jgi:hypothetical protein
MGAGRWKTATYKGIATPGVVPSLCRRCAEMGSALTKAAGV